MNRSGLRRVFSGVGLIILSLGLAHCTPPSHESGVAKKEIVPAETPAKPQPTLLSVQKDISNKRCLSCHVDASDKNRFVSLIDLGQIIETSSHAHVHDGVRRNLIKPGCPKQSFFLSIIKEGKMPPQPLERLSAEELKAVEDWITSLNPNAVLSCVSDEPPDLTNP